MNVNNKKLPSSTPSPRPLVYSKSPVNMDAEYFDDETPKSDKKDNKDGKSVPKVSSGPKVSPADIKALALLKGVGPEAFNAKLSNFPRRVLKHDHSYSGITAITNAVSTTAASFPINLVLQGDGSNNRVGSQITCKSIAIRGRLSWNGTAGAAVSDDLYINPVRMIVAIDTMAIAQVVTAVPIATTSDPPVDGNTLLVGQQNYLCMAPYNYMTHNVRYKILHNHVYQPAEWSAWFESAGSVALARNVEFDLLFDLHDLPVTYYSDASAAPLDNNLLVFFVYDNIGSPVVPNYSYALDLTFTDVGND